MSISITSHPKIRNAVEADVPLLLQMIRELAAYEKLEKDVITDEALFAQNMFGYYPYAAALIAEDEEGNPLGMALYYFTFSTFLGRPSLYIEDLFVRTGARRNGVGRRFIRELSRIARDRGCGRMQWSILDWNEGAIKFYESFGAHPIDGWQLLRIERDVIIELAK
jgi:GNAT superfamily N-acetyltransferase